MAYLAAFTALRLHRKGQTIARFASRKVISRRYSWIVFTATGALRQILEGFGAPLIELGRADPSSVAAAADSWGRYYETDPRVFAGYLPDADRLAGFAHRTLGH